MDLLKAPALFPVEPISGLFISDRFAAASVSNIRSHNIKRILSVIEPQEVPHFDDAPVDIRNIDIDDEPTVDILEHLQDACDWIQEGLNLNSKEENQAGVLIHCRQGISRSGSFAVAYFKHPVMRSLNISMQKALSIAQDSCPRIFLNEGFYRQLQIWEQCSFEVFTEGESAGKQKPAYKAWIDERDNLLKSGEEAVNKARVSAMASTAARLGRKRQETLNRSN